MPTQWLSIKLSLLTYDVTRREANEAYDDVGLYLHHAASTASRCIELQWNRVATSQWEITSFIIMLNQ